MENLIDGFASLPGIGRKSAQRLAFHVLSLPQEEADRFANAVLEAKKSVHTCPVCQNLTDGELCPVCASDSRDKTTIASYPSRAMCSASSAAGNTTAYTMCSTALSRR